MDSGTEHEPGTDSRTLSELLEGRAELRVQAASSAPPTFQQCHLPL